MIPKSATAQNRAIPLLVIVLLALAVHGPLLLMQLPANSYDATTHIFFASHYASHWFSPWNEKWFGGMSQTTYPPLTHQWIALFSHVFGLTGAYMVVQLIVILLLPVGMYRYAKLWVPEREASYAAVGTVFLGSLSMLIYQSGQLPTLTAAALTLNALPYFYSWSRDGVFRNLLKGAALSMTGAAAHHVTFLFGAVLFALPVLWLTLLDRNESSRKSSAAAVLARAVAFGAIILAAAIVVLLPYFISLRQNPINQLPIPHGSRDNYLLNLHSGMNFWIIPMGALILAIPYILLKGSAERRLRPLLFGWYLTTLLGLGGTTPVGRLLLGRAYEVLTYERFTFWATLMALPFVGLLAAWMIDRWNRRAVVALGIAAVYSCAMAVAWVVFNPINTGELHVQPVIDFLNREEHSRYRYITLGFSNQFAKVSTYANAGSLDGDYNSARLLPELTAYGAGQLYNSKYYGTAGMESLRAILKHADQYGLRYVFVRDRYYEPLLAFAGWRQAESYDNGAITLWTKDDVPPAKHIDFGNAVPPAWQGVMWGVVPVGVSLLAIFLVLLPDRRRYTETIEFPTSKASEISMRGAQ
ncbi:MAG TPA: DUF6541 family protein [Candidatus Saccharimonadales bacterium]|nr:DUF6541 family protein [Candidatus Saccharimonadales bacterium]